MAVRFGWRHNWLTWLTSSTPLFVLLGVVALLGAVYLCAVNSPLATSAAVAYQIAGALLAVAQFVGLQNHLNPGWLTREIREWWARRPRKLSPVTASGSAVLSGITAHGYGGVLSPLTGTPEEQMHKIWQKLATVEAAIVSLKGELQRQREEQERRLSEVQQTMLGASREVEQRLSGAITSAPLQAATGLWLILLGLSMQVYLAL